MKQRYERWEYRHRKEIRFVVLLVIGLTLTGYLFVQIQTLEVSETFNAFSEIKPAPVTESAAPAVIANETKETPEPHQFTPDLKVFGSPEFVKNVQDSLDELNKTPDFRINNRTAYEYASYWSEEIHEGEYGGVLRINGTEYWGRREGYPPGIHMIPITHIDASNLIHLARHTEQSQRERALWINKSNCEYELDAIKKGEDWRTARYNLTEEQKEQNIKALISSYKNWETGQVCVP